jgi:hypothetical protein
MIKSHNNAKKLVELEAIAPEKLTVEQTAELEILQKRKKACVDPLLGLPEFGLPPQCRFSGYYDKNGNKMSYWDYLGYSWDLEYTIIKRDYFGDFFVSTVWLGSDSGFGLRRLGGFHIPIIFETMIFNDSDEEHGLHCYQERYATEEMAIIGHKEACKLAQAAEINIKGKNEFID